MEVVRPGLWRWTTAHPDWVEGATPGSTGDWPRDVGSVAFAGRDAFTLVDPLVDDDTWPQIDALVRGHGMPVWILQTIRWHDRSVPEAAERYAATTAVPDEPPPRELPSGVRAIPIEGADETMFWIEPHRALVPGDRLLGSADGGLSVCPDTWLAASERHTGRTPTREEVALALRPLLDLPVELVLVSHGRPVLRDGRGAIARALEAR